ncbi:hypothetical protein G7046_g9175 [Stylonectria norvegica]|nr:hypothetical protein G7046_g9175 [Stylonectria norvegica]
MATVDDTRPVDAVAPIIEDSPRDAGEAEGLKRRASTDERDDSPKRIKQDTEFRNVDDHPRRESPSNRRGSRDNSGVANVDRHKSATQEEKKRGKRLFGGLLNTLSQTTSDSQRKRRQDIERRQKERQEKQIAEDEQKRLVKAAHLRDIRAAEQITFDEEVMRNKHAKSLALAQYLRTTSEPHIYYLPWKLTESQETQIEERLQDAKTTIQKELKSFEARKERQDGASGRRRTPTPSVEPPAPVLSGETVEDKPAHSSNGTEQPIKSLEKDHNDRHHSHHHHHHHHDEADVLEEADEDTVIY